ncbi:hypothetical protein [Brevundimonas diminuta]|uniref:hypothetical protein n=1 Tax=Brevundimonas diminuta TaxID=293 RepID=UPI0028ABA571|nr:hypothetical protein [Brevundimonas diminuta]
MIKPPCDKGAPKAEQPGAAERTEVEKAQLALDDLDTMHGQATRRCDEALQALRTRCDDERQAYEAQRKALQERLKKARARL